MSDLMRLYLIVVVSPGELELGREGFSASSKLSFGVRLGKVVNEMLFGRS